MQKYPAVILHKNKTQAVKRFQPWVFSGAVKQKNGNPDQGDVVEVFSEDGEYLGIGHFGTGSLSVRIFSFEKIYSLDDLWKKKLQNAFLLRRKIGLTESKTTNTYRLVNAEGDGMPGLIIDWYNGTAVIQCHSKAMNAEKEKFVEILKQGYGGRLKAVYDKSANTLHHKAETETQNPQYSDSYLFGKPEERIVLENCHKFAVDWEQGQKTGFFIDQRDNRQLLSHYVKDKKVLNTFCYSGGFSVYALSGDAALVHSVDSSAKAIELTEENMKLNKTSGIHESFASDVFDFMKASTEEYDVIVLDPPAFAKGQSARHHAIQAYTRLNQVAFKKIKKGGPVVSPFF